MKWLLRGHVRIFVVGEQLNMIFGFCNVLCGGLLGYETVSEILIHSVFTLPEPLLSASYCIIFCCSAVTTACSTAAVPSVRIYGYPGWANVMWSTLSRL